ncbi:MAG: glycine-rich domain-containing protein, partial [Pseudomonadota bacterium]
MITSRTCGRRCHQICRSTRASRESSNMPISRHCSMTALHKLGLALRRSSLVLGGIALLGMGAAWADEETFTLVNDDGSVERVHIFTGDGSFEVPAEVAEVEYLVVGGGGGGGGGSSAGGGGGGAGGLREGSANVDDSTTYSVGVGSGGAGGRGGESADFGSDGGDSWIQDAAGDDLVRSNGGGGGARGEIYTGHAGRDGGSGGGGSRWSGGGSGTSGEGNEGGGSEFDLGPGSSGGGGAAEAGKSESGSAGGDGGAGKTSTITGRERAYAGGGGGGNHDSGTRSDGGTGGGGKGGHWDNGWRGQSASANTGGGGGGGGGTVSWWNPDGNNGGSGGSGIVVVRYTLPDEPDYEKRTIGDDTVHIYRGTGAHEFTVPDNVTEVEYLVVGGGGAGGSAPDSGSATAKGTGGGGAGAFRRGRMEVEPGEGLALEVGAGGSVTAGDRQGESGQDSRLGELIASGGGGGGAVSSDGSAGGSGGGGGGRSGDYVGGDGVRGLGFAGGRVTTSTTSGKAAGGGGGGAGGAGEPGFVTKSYGGGGDGGPGLVSTITGNAQWYAGGGGAGATDGQDTSPDGGLGGRGGGGDGRGDSEQGDNAEPGRPFTGGGGGGIGVTNASGATLGGAGGSGIVVIRYSTADETDNGASVRIDEIPQVTEPQAVQVPVNVDGFDGASELIAFVRLDDNAGTLTITDTTGLSLEVGYDSFEKAQSIGFRGTRAEVEAALAGHLEWNAPLEAVESDLNVEVTEAETDTFYNPDNGHYYKVMDGGTATDWQDARTAAKNETLFGMTGYLATITSREENDFTANNIQGADIWVGASDDYAVINAVCDSTLYDQQGTFGVSSDDGYRASHPQYAEGRWYWVTGPEACTQFWAGEGQGSGVAGRFVRWSNGEPNNDHSGTEHYAGTNFGGDRGQWNDFRSDNTSANDFLVEFGGLPGDSST